jgi:hypothetical protein
MNNSKPDPRTMAWVHREVARLHLEGYWEGSPRERDLLAHWKVHNLKMYQTWEAAGLVEKLAFVLEMKRYQAARMYRISGMAYSDSEEQATKDWCLMEPEAEEHRDTNRRRR